MVRDVHKTYIKLYLFIWKPYSEYSENNGIKDGQNKLNNASLDNDFLKDRLNIDINRLTVQDYSSNFILYNNENITVDNPIENHVNQFDQLLEISFDVNSFFYGINSVGFPEKNFEYKITQFKGSYIFCWTYHVFQPDGIYNNLSPLNKLIISNDSDSYNVEGQIFDTSQFTKDDFIYDPNDPLMVWSDTFENSFIVSLRDEEKILFKSYLNLLQKDFSSTISSNIDISCVEITFLIWTPNNSKYDKILGEDLSSNNNNGWVLPDDYYGIQDPRLFFTPYKSNTISWNPSFQSTSYDSSGTTHYGYNFDLSGVIKRRYLFKKKGNSFNIDFISDISFNDLSFNITKNDISYNQNDTLYNIDNKFPNTLEYLKIDDITNVEYGIPYLSRWMHTVYDMIIIK